MSTSDVVGLKAIIGSKIRALRGTRSQESIAKASGVNRQLVAAIEQGSRDYRIETFLKVLSVFAQDEPQRRFTLPFGVKHNGSRKRRAG